MSSEPGGGGHSLADHALGALFAHSHDGHDHDHDHDHDFPDEGGGHDGHPLISLGIDIGSSGTQAAFTRLLPDGSVPDGEPPFHLSPVMLTPIGPNGAIDETVLGRIFDGFFAGAGIGPDSVDTGAVILTGAAAEAGNAAAIGARVAAMAGDLVCATAGDHIEALFAAYGSGAIELSREGGGRRLLLADIGGATTKFAIVHAGEVEATAAMTVGGRLIVTDRADRITRLDRGGALFARLAGFAWQRGDVIVRTDLAAVAGAMAERVGSAILALLARAVPPDAVTSLMLTAWPMATGPIDGLLVSGGVAEYFYAREKRDFGDLGPVLGRALRRRIDAAGAVPVLEPRERIRSTVLGASSHSLQMSGDTIFVSSHARLLPRRNLPVVRPRVDLSGPIDPAAVGAAIAAERMRLARDAGEVAVALSWSGDPSHARLRALADGIAAGMGEGPALYILVEGDIARTLGAILRDEIGIAREALVVDGVRVRDFDHVDLGRIRLPSGRVPVTIKSMRFGTALSASGMG